MLLGLAMGLAMTYTKRQHIPFIHSGSIWVKEIALLKKGTQQQTRLPYKKQDKNIIYMEKLNTRTKHLKNKIHKSAIHLLVSAQM
jgi:hypothetical protein